MAKKKAQTKDDSAEAAAVLLEEKEEDNDEEYDDDDDEEELDLLQVELGDMVKLKQVLDETVSVAILDQVEEDCRFDNFKLCLMTVACIFAVVAQFAPIPFPDSRPILGACCCLYFILSGVLQFITTYIDKDCILLTKAVEKNEKNTDMEKHGLRVRSQLPRFSEWYKVILEFEGRQDTPSVEQVWSIGQFFDSDGMFDEIGLKMEVNSLYLRLAAGKYDSKSSSDKAKQS
uniref:Signal peptidase complex subunit 2 n=1 Tax=Craspedostauros australis TaxID=1486917 RepID=A0A7S0F5H5_9STRA|mmetsp:Transcript_6903/g.18745  ORF Transcript_6903/g.18745 Transcript_6903/m.18745 type:complete len:231 (+) Transcript_6903:130-822(+)|eukprot:CAMPEP_0198115250 /NCGR_PEP_ID=MMETSP1442-20131203/6416_1 /TAXON_ID= /ORGANISM="Craspedostauros australis, Strain CCMP3328" /LENGTH=230 /DNA_ID=CAMNT_0043772731 /DNA_START=88 /DNA_END=780 /DNA_ORIENTATION=-